MNPEIVGLIGICLLLSCLIAVGLGSLIRWGEGRQRRKDDFERFQNDKDATMFEKKQAD